MRRMKWGLKWMKMTTATGNQMNWLQQDLTSTESTLGRGHIWVNHFPASECVSACKYSSFSHVDDFCCILGKDYQELRVRKRERRQPEIIKDLSYLHWERTGQPPAGPFAVSYLSWSWCCYPFHVNISDASHASVTYPHHRHYTQQSWVKLGLYWDQTSCRILTSISLRDPRVAPRLLAFLSWLKVRVWNDPWEFSLHFLANMLLICTKALLLLLGDFGETTFFQAFCVIYIFQNVHLIIISPGTPRGDSKFL